MCMWVSDAVWDCIGGVFVVFYISDDHDHNRKSLVVSYWIMIWTSTFANSIRPQSCPNHSIHSPNRHKQSPHPLRNGLEFSQMCFADSGPHWSAVGRIRVGYHAGGIVTGSGIWWGGFEEITKNVYNLRIYEAGYCNTSVRGGIRCFFWNQKKDS